MDPLVTTDWLAAHLADPDVRVVDGSWHMPHLKRDPGAEFAAAHIPGAVFFDIDAIADHSTSLPHMLPGAGEFARAVGALGIGEGDRVVVYDTKGVVSAARVWWTFRAFGHDTVAVLDGGLPKWRADSRAIASGPAAPAPRRFTAKPRPELVRDLAAMRANVTATSAQVLDARSHGRFVGTEPEPRAGLRGGHIPGSRNLPYDQLYQPDGTLALRDELEKKFAASGIDLAKPIVTTCGSGVTASVLALGLALCGRPDVAVYDGSWSEWGGLADVPVEVGGPEMAPKPPAFGAPRQSRGAPR
jgi:thiosulfate/3-mercaptopyruvate sulfurtransferase